MDCGLWVSGGGLLIRGLLWCDFCCGVIVVVCLCVIVVVVWWFACSVSEKRETKRKRDKKIETMMLYMMNILL